MRKIIPILGLAGLVTLGSLASCEFAIGLPNDGDTDLPNDTGLPDDGDIGLPGERGDKRNRNIYRVSIEGYGVFSFKNSENSYSTIGADGLVVVNTPDVPFSSELEARLEEVRKRYPSNNIGLISIEDMILGCYANPEESSNTVKSDWLMYIVNGVKPIEPGDPLPGEQVEASKFFLDTLDVEYTPEVKARLEEVREKYWDLVIDPVFDPENESLLTGFDVGARVMGAGNSFMDNWIRYIADGVEPSNSSLINIKLITGTGEVIIPDTPEDPLEVDVSEQFTVYKDTIDIEYSIDVEAKLEEVRGIYWDLEIDPVFDPLNERLLMGFDVSPLVYKAGDKHLDNWLEYIVGNDRPSEERGDWPAPPEERLKTTYFSDTDNVEYTPEVQEREEEIKELMPLLTLEPVFNPENILIGYNVTSPFYGGRNLSKPTLIDYIATGEFMNNMHP
ncbi:hypothetical protein CMO89_01150 [Candidatus Woesearchaeota archaeon]|nr:hypothetical protein [Candidatus Woesearchaeota archaeon]|tara:strand:+ start:41 stop:1381 length:1341 start_codon:yes stop_codon:yes gene_type:complete